MSDEKPNPPPPRQPIGDATKSGKIPSMPNIPPPPPPPPPADKK